jgi:O-6-methylguanine DNA methyltransferase
MNIETTWGTIEIDWIDGKVVGCTLPYLSTQPNTRFSSVKGGSPPVSTFIAALFSGKKVNPPALAELAGTDFQQQVWKGIADIPPGQTKTYGELARAIGRPNAVRAVGSACGRNPVPLFIPCHRVVGSNGGLGGFSCGLPWKELLLSLEKSR